MRLLWRGVFKPSVVTFLVGLFGSNMEQILLKLDKITSDVADLHGKRERDSLELSYLRTDVSYLRNNGQETRVRFNLIDRNIQSLYERSNEIENDLRGLRVQNKFNNEKGTEKDA